MRKNGQAKAAKKAGNVAAEGTIIIKEGAGFAALVEVNCQTDFVAKDASFLGFANEVADAAAAAQTTIEDLQAKFEEQRVQLVAKIGENISVALSIEGISLTVTVSALVLLLLVKATLKHLSMLRCT